MSELPKLTDIHELPLKKLPLAGTIVINGRSGSGKSVATRNLMRHYKDVMDVVVVMCGSKETCEEYREHVPAAYVHYVDKFDKQRVAKLQEWYDTMETFKEQGRDVRMLLIFDDLAFMKGKVSKNETVAKILYNGRHPRILLIWCMQDSLNVGPDLRNQTSLTFSTFDKNPGNRERLFNAFNPCFPNTAAGLRQFEKALRACTQDRGLIVLDNTYNESTDIADNVYFFEPKFPVPPFKMMRNNPGRKYDELKQEYDRGHPQSEAVPTTAPTDTGLQVTKVYNKSKKRRRERESSSSSDDDEERAKRRAKRKRSKQEIVTIR